MDLKLKTALVAGWAVIAGNTRGQTPDTIAFIPDQQLREVVVVAKLPEVEMKADRMTFRLESSVGRNQGNMFDVLNSLPGVSLQPDGTVYLNGQAGATILIDGKPAYLAGPDLVTLLKSTPAATTDKIDLITHPSARYEASGASGLIDIRTKKIRLRGMNVSFHTSYAQGKKGEGYTALSLNVRREKFNFFLTYSYSGAKDYNQLHVDRTFLRPRDQQEEGLRLTQESLKTWRYHAHYYRTGFDYDLSPRTTLGLSTHGNFFDNTETATMNDLFTGSSMQPDSSLLTNRGMHESRRNFSAGVTLDHRLDPENSRLSASFDYLRYRYAKQQDIRSLFRSLPQTGPNRGLAGASAALPGQSQSAESLGTDTLLGEMGGSIQQYAAQVRLEFPLREHWALSAGGKSSYVQIDNDVAYRKAGAGRLTDEPSLSDRFAYEENINAGYLSLHVGLGNLQIEAGLRLENTRIAGRQGGESQQRDSSFAHRYTHLFPSVSLQYALAGKNAVSLAYGRRINRPNYGDLNPFLYIHDDYTYEQGNTLLRCELSDHLEAMFMLRDLGKAGLFFSYTQDAIVNSFVEKKAHRVLVTPQNYARALVFGPRLATAALPLASWWDVNLNGSLLFTSFRLPADYPVSNNRQLTPSVSLTQQFRWRRNWTAELSGTYTGRLIAGPFTLCPIGEMNLGIEKKILGGKGSLRLFARDVWHTHRLKREIRTPGQRAYTAERQNRSVAGISFTYRLSRGTEAKDSGRNSGTDESKRINL